MSLRSKITNHFIRLFTLGVIAVTLTACFRPMLAEQPGSTSVTTSLADIYIETVPGRVGQRLRNQLIYYFSGVNQSQAAAYRLTISLSQSETSGLVQPNTNALAKTVDLNARYTLIDTETDKPIHAGEAFARATFDKTAALFSNERAELDAENRAADALAEDIRTRIAAYFASQQG